MTDNTITVNYEEIAKRLKELRESKNMTQAELGEIAKVSNKAVWAWENGKSIPRMGSLQRIADYFCVQLNWIIEGVVNTNRELEELHEIASTFNEEQLARLMHYARFIKSEEK